MNKEYTVAVRDFGNKANLALVVGILENLGASFTVFGATEAWVEKFNQPYDFYVAIFHKPDKEVYQVRDRWFRHISPSAMFDTLRALQRKPHSA